MVSETVLHVCSYYAGTKLYRRLFDKLSEKGVKQKVFYFTAREDSVAEMPADVVVSQAYSRWKRPVFPLKHRPVYRDAVRKLEISNTAVSHAHSLFSNGYVSWRLNREHGLPYIVAVRNTDINTFVKYKPHLIPLGRKIIEQASSVVFLSPAYLEATERKIMRSSDLEAFRAKSVVIPNGIDDEFLCQEYVNRQTSELNVVQVARGLSDENKNVATTLAACKLLIDDGYSLRLTLVGELPESKFAAEIRQHEFVDVVGGMGATEIRKILRSSSVFVMPSRYESFGLVYAEAMSQGVPVIYTRGQGFDGQFPDGEVGYSVDYLDVSGVASRIIDLWRDSPAVGRRAVDAAQRFDWSRIAERYVGLYSKAGYAVSK